MNYTQLMLTASKTQTTQQRSLETRDSLVWAALREFAARGFDGATTRAIARRAGVAQSAVPYHFSTKEALWRAAADRIFGIFQSRLHARLAGLEGVDEATRTRLVLIDFVRLVAEHPELHRFMLQEGAGHTERLEWLVSTHVRPFLLWFRELIHGVKGFARGISIRPDHLVYMLIGAASTPYALAPEFELSMGENPFSKEMVEAHAHAIIELFFDDPEASMEKHS